MNAKNANNKYLSSTFYTKNFYVKTFFFLSESRCGHWAFLTGWGKVGSCKLHSVFRCGHCDQSFHNRGNFENFNAKFLLIKIIEIVLYCINFQFFFLKFDHLHNFFHIFTVKIQQFLKYSGHSRCGHFHTSHEKY